MMGAFRNLNVQVKLLAGFGVLAALAGGIALVGTRDLNASDNDISVLHEQYFSLIAELSDLTADVGTVRTDMMGMVDYDGTESITLGWNGVKKASTEVDNSFERLATTVTDRTLRTRLNDIQHTWEQFRDANESQLL